MPTSVTGGEVTHISGRLLHGSFEGRGTDLFRRFSSQKARQPNKIDGRSHRDMAQMGFAQTNIS